MILNIPRKRRFFCGEITSNSNFIKPNKIDKDSKVCDEKKDKRIDKKVDDDDDDFDDDDDNDEEEDKKKVWDGWRGQGWRSRRRRKRRRRGRSCEVVIFKF